MYRPFRRAFSISIRRMASAAAAKNGRTWPRNDHLRQLPPASNMPNASGRWPARSDQGFAEPVSPPPACVIHRKRGASGFQPTADRRIRFASGRGKSLHDRPRQRSGS